MRLYEVGEHVQEGLSVTLGQIKPCISLGLDLDTNEWHSIELGNSIRRELKHPADRGEVFRLKRGHFDCGAQNILKLLAMYDSEPDDDLALVVVQRCWLPDVPINMVESAYKCTDPEHLQRSRSDGSGYDTFLFRPGDGLHITWHRRLTTMCYELRFVVKWDGRDLLQLEDRGRRGRYAASADQALTA